VISCDGLEASAVVMVFTKIPECWLHLMAGAETPKPCMPMETFIDKARTSHDIRLNVAV
jgi:hypothetical protein